MANHMSEVAELLEVELGEVFRVDNCRSVAEMYYRLTEDGLEQSDTPNGEWEDGDEWILALLLTGEADIIQLPWKPQNGEFYFSPSPTRKSLQECLAWVGGENDNYRLNRGFVFRTPDEAVAVARKMLTVAREEGEMINDK